MKHAILTVIFSLLLLPTLHAEEQAVRTFHSADGRVTYTVTEWGLSSIKVGDHELATGCLIPFDASPMLTPADNPIPQHPSAAGGYAAYLFPEQQKKITETLLGNSDGQTVLVLHELPGMGVYTVYHFDDRDITIIVRMENKSIHPIQIPSLGGLKFTFPAPPEGRMRTWHPSYLQHANRDCFHPSHLNHIGGSYAIGGKIGVGVSPDYMHILTATEETPDPFAAPIIPTLIHWDYNAWEEDRRDAEPIRWLTYSERREVPAGSTITMRFRIRIADNCGTPVADADWQNLMQPYKDHYLQLIGGLQYNPDFRLVASAYINHSQGAVSAENPYGLHGGYNRLDTETGVSQFCETFIPAIQKCDGQGMIIWGHSGDHPRGAMYRPDVDAVPPKLDAGLREVASRFRTAGIHVGVCTRPGELVTPADYANDTVLQLSPSEPTQLDHLRRQFKNLAAMGFSIYYLDSFGMRPEHVEIMRHLRRWLGPDVQTYAEHPCDLILAYSGGYSETDFHAKAPDGKLPDRWVLYAGEEDVKVYHWLLGRAPIIARHYSTHGEMPADFEAIENYVKRLRLIHLLPSHQFKFQ